MNKNIKMKKGFTLIEILVVMGIIAILAAIVLIAISPARQFAQARNTHRTSNVNAILNAIGQYVADNQGILPGAIEDLTLNAETDLSSVDADIDDLCVQLVPKYIPALPVDPTVDPDGGGGYEEGEALVDGDCDAADTWDTGYTIERVDDGRVVVCSPLADEDVLDNPGPICVTR